MAGVSFTIDNKQVFGVLTAIARQGDDTAPALHAMGAYMVFSTQRNFERETAPDGTPWRPLSPRTAGRRVGRGRRGFDHILRDTTRLYRSIVYAVDPNGVEWGTNVVYGRIHQLGGQVTIPPRQQTIRLRRVKLKSGAKAIRFAKPSHRSATERSVALRAHTITIPARPFLGVSPADGVELVQIGRDHLSEPAR